MLSVRTHYLVVRLDIFFWKTPLNAKGPFVKHNGKYKMFSDLTLIDYQNFWDMVEKSQPKVSRPSEITLCQGSSSGNYEEKQTSEATTKKQRKTRSDKKYKNEEERNLQGN